MTQEMKDYLNERQRQELTRLKLKFKNHFKLDEKTASKYFHEWMNELTN